jgi:CTP:molybdopterin cytidylyltransferase MocA
MRYNHIIIDNRFKKTIEARIITGEKEMKKTALVIMAAGIGSRFGTGIKQLAPVGPKGEIIMDYSIRDALEAGFNKVVFIIRILRRNSARSLASGSRRSRK